MWSRSMASDARSGSAQASARSRSATTPRRNSGLPRLDGRPTGGYFSYRLELRAERAALCVDRNLAQALGTLFGGRVGGLLSSSRALDQRVDWRHDQVENDPGGDDERKQLVEQCRGGEEDAIDRE